MLHLQWTKETKDLKLSGLGKEKGTIGDRDTTHQSRGQIWIHKKSTTKNMLGTANFPPKMKHFLTVQFQGCRRVFVTTGRGGKSCVGGWYLLFGPACLAAANYGFVQVVDGWSLVRPPAWASGPVTTLTTPRSSSATRVYTFLINSFSSSECHKSMCNFVPLQFIKDLLSFQLQVSSKCCWDRMGRGYILWIVMIHSVLFRIISPGLLIFHPIMHPRIHGETWIAKSFVQFV